MAALILPGTALLILFMAMVGAADNRRTSRLPIKRPFSDRLRGMERCEFFGRGEAETESICAASQDFVSARWKHFYLPACWNFSPRFHCAGRRLFWLSFGRIESLVIMGTGVTLAAGFSRLDPRRSFSSRYATSARFTML